MSLFGAIGISTSGLDAAQSWINTTAGNIANANDVGPTSQGAYAVETPIFQPMGVAGQVGDGVTVTGVELGDTTGVVEHDPINPQADAQGNVRITDVNLGNQMVGLIQAQETYQANASAMEHAKTAYQSALELGK
jgi:flagellar basal-body rod protein FlgC